MEHESKSVKVADMERAKVVVEGIVEQLVVHCEIERLFTVLEVQRRLRRINGSLGSLGG
jgi:hypothetical protein